MLDFTPAHPKNITLPIKNRVGCINPLSDKPVAGAWNEENQVRLVTRLVIAIPKQIIPLQKIFFLLLTIIQICLQ